MRKTLLEENFEVVSEVYLKNILDQFFCTDSSCLVTVSHETSISLLLSFFRHENSVHYCFVSSCILRPIRPVTMKKSCWSNISRE